MEKINNNGFNVEELKLISNIYDMMERGFTFKPNIEAIVVIKGEVEDQVKEQQEKKWWLLKKHSKKLEMI